MIVLLLVFVASSSLAKISCPSATEQQNSLATQAPKTTIPYTPITYNYDEPAKLHGKSATLNSMDFFEEIKITDIIIAIATVAIASYTYRLWKSTNNLWVETKTSIELTRKEFVSTHRPRIRVRRMVLSGFHAMYGAEHISHGQEISINVTISNVGGTNAHIVDSRYQIVFYKDKVPAEIPYEDPPHRLTEERILLAVGQERTFEITGQAMLKDPGNGTLIVRQFRCEGWSMLVVGELTYRDDNDRDRRTGFLRVTLPPQFNPS